MTLLKGIPTVNNDEYTLHIETGNNGISLVDIIEKCKEKWPDVQLIELNFQAQLLLKNATAYNRDNEYSNCIVVKRMTNIKGSNT